MPLIGGLALSCGFFSGLVSLGVSMHNLSGLVLGGLCPLAVGVINAVNLSDGIDGLYGTLALVALLGLGIVSYGSALHGQLQLVVLLFCATVAFLIFNMRTHWRHRASVFLGGAGSMFMGFAVGRAAD